jgi:hypothetical protein
MADIEVLQPKVADKMADNSSNHKDSILQVLCHVPWDHIPSRSYPLFKARAILEGILSTHGYKAKRT